MTNRLLDSRFSCDCGKEHYITIKKILIENDAFNKLPEVMDRLTKKNKILMICDQNTYQAAGKKAVNILVKKDYDVNLLKIKGNKVVPNTDNLNKILNRITKDEYLLACGSGTINDLSAYAAFKRGISYSVIATAPSMDGYASSVSSITTQGVKQTYNTKPPEAIIADIGVLKNAPKRLIQAGYGDLLGKTTSLLDWKLANLLFDEYFCNKAFHIIEDELYKIINTKEGFNFRSEKNIVSLIKGLINSGLAMQLVGSSRPASGSEHHISHFIEMFGDDYNLKMPLHGTKVGIAALFTTLFYLELKNIDFSKINLVYNKKNRIKKIKNIYKNRSKPILKNLEDRWQKDNLLKEKLLNSKEDILLLVEQNLKKILKTRKILQQKDTLNNNIIKQIPKKLTENALKYGFEIRSRYTVTTLLDQIDKLEQLTDKLLNKYYQ
ncbi:MAG: sn-glycerol-1-phosphate dehydrogenase [Halanaerobiales bacterium]|nr:sn-glycerol-1-phosphate dehydrogenase [Halanaerobiales bacterium]